MPDLSQIIQAGAAHAWFYLPVAVVLGALLPGHAKSLMAAYIISIRGTPRQAALLGLSATVGHTLVVWILAVSALLLGQNLIAEQAEPWLTLLSGVLVTLLAVRMFLRLRAGNHHHHGHNHHSHSHGHDHAHDHPRPKVGATATDIVWFGLTGGLLPCPAAIAVLLVCIQLKQFALGVVIVAAFSIGLALTLIAIGMAASWASKKASTTWPWLDRVAQKLPYLSAGIVMTLGLVMTTFGLHATWLASQGKPNPQRF